MENKLPFVNSLGFAILGLIITIVALPVSDVMLKNYLFIVGGVFLTISSFLDKELLFFWVNGVGMAIAIFIVISLPNNIIFVLSIFITIYGCYHTLKNTRLRLQILVGLLGFIFLSLGTVFSFINFTLSNIFMSFSGIALCIYACYSIYVGHKISWIFLLLNMLFTIVALLAVSDILII
ncbi:hypothetical protein [Francisella sp. SYW-9]|uniref:hypothetical protein n=1 Tax=Francisella sp. SYW-9 TaxID=2610888 RepID=UPI00123CEE67|nr:hypothetical protein [Francisella sp. SYW-9]